jgi:predicted metal-dependent phosphoesterase TrpH
MASMAHPGVTKRDELIGPLVNSGMDAIEIYHSDHTPEDQYHYQVIAHRYDILVTGGSDFHGEETRRNTIGVVTLPAAAFDALREAHERRSS